MIEKFEDLTTWKQAQLTCIHLIRLGNSLKERSLQDQLKRAAISVPLNIAEGFERSSRPDFVRFLRISLGSASECKAVLFILRDLELLSQIEFEEHVDRIEHTKALIKCLISKLRSKHIHNRG